MIESYRFRLLAYGAVPIGLGGVTRHASHSLVERQRSLESGKLRAKFQSAPMVPTRSSAPLEVSSVRCRCEVNLCIPAKLPEDQIRVSERHRGPFWGSKFALPSCSSGVWLVSRAVAPAIAAAVQQHAMKMATGIHPQGPATTRLWLIAGVNPAARKPKFVPIAMPEKRTRVSNISPKKDGQIALVAA